MNELIRDVADFSPSAEVRPFQDQFIKTIFSAVEEGCSVAIEGSNGLGKTIAALSACLPKAFENLKILYVAHTPPTRPCAYPMPIQPRKLRFRSATLKSVT